MSTSTTAAASTTTTTAHHPFGGGGVSNLGPCTDCRVQCLNRVPLHVADLPVIKADIALEETYTPPNASELAAFPIVSVYGAKTPGRDKEKSAVEKSAAELWRDATTSTCAVLGVPDVDWYVFQEEKGVKAVLAEVQERMGAAAAVGTPVAVS